ncbi:MAG: preprotein translocase subunit YajC [Nitrospinota bacterium]
MLSQVAYAMAPPAGAEPSGFDMIMSFAPLIFLVLIFYFLIIRPQNKKQQETKDMQHSLAEGDNVMTTGGIYGTISKIKDDVIVLKVAENVKLKINVTNILEKK